MMPPGVVVVPVGHQPRFHAFTACLMRLMAALPEGSVLKMTAGPDVTHNINKAIERGLTALPTAAWAWVVGDDHTFEPTIVEKLWASNLPVIVPHVRKRSSPFEAVIYTVDFEPITPQREQRGLLQVAIAGGAGMLIRRDVLDAIGRPWFENRGNERQGEDIAFCLKLHKLNIPLFVNLDVSMGHITPMEVWPAFHPEKGWGVSLRNRSSEEDVF